MEKVVFSDMEKILLGDRRKSRLTLERRVKVRSDEYGAIKVTLGTFGKGPRGGEIAHPLTLTFDELEAIIVEVRKARAEAIEMGSRYTFEDEVENDLRNSLSPKTYEELRELLVMAAEKGEENV